MTVEPTPQYQSCRNCNGTGRRPVSLAFAGICTQCVNGRVRTEQTRHVILVGPVRRTDDGARTIAIRTDTISPDAQVEAHAAASRELAADAHLSLRRFDPADPTYYFTDRVVTYA